MNNEVSRSELLQWLNDTFKLGITKLEILGTGAIYCLILDAVHPGKVALPKINWKAKQEYEYVNNFKILQQAFTKLGIQKPIEVERLTKCKLQDNLEFLQWLKKYVDTHIIPKDYDPISRRANQDVEDFDKPIRNNSKSKSRPPQFSLNPLSKNSSLATIQGYNSEFSNKENSGAKVGDLLIQIDTLKAERDFYFQKFTQLDAFLEDNQHLEVYKQLKNILYETSDKSIRITTLGEMEFQSEESQSEDIDMQYDLS